MAPYVRSWHLADIWASAPQMSDFGGKADMVIALQMSAYDPKRTWAIAMRPFQSASLSRYDPLS
jgi:hypothetical protein